MKTLITGSNGMVGSTMTRHLMVRKVLLVCGILSSLLYVATLILGAMRWEGYSSTSQTVSELIAINAPTRPFVVPLFIMYSLLVYAFGVGVWQAAGRKRALRVAAVGLVGKEVLGLVVTLFFPIHLRGVEGTLTDTMHGILTLVGVLFMLLAIGFGATAFGKRFRLYSIGTFLLLVVGGVLAGLDQPRLAANLPTPWMGVWERINIFAYMLWVVVLAIALLRAQVEQPQNGLAGIRESLVRKENIMTTIKAFIKRHPVLTYFVLAFVLSWGSIIIVVGGIPGPKTQSEGLLPFALLAMFAGPSVAGLLLTGLVYGRTGLRELRSRLLKWRVGARWYAVALLTAPLSLTASLFALSLLSPEFLPGILTTSDKASLLLFGLVAGLATGFFEELGWTGFAVPWLRLRYGLFTTGLFVGLVWGAWHFLVNLWGSDTASGALSLALFLPVVLFSFLPPYRVLMVWVYDRTGSLLVAMLMHASLVAFWLISTPLAIAGVSLVTWYLVWAAVLWVAVAAVTPKAAIKKERPAYPR